MIQIEQMNDLLSRLEMQKIVDLTSELCLSELGFDALESATDPESWAATIEVATQYQQETYELLPLVDRDQLWGPLRDLPSPLENLEALSKGAVLSEDGLATLRGWIFAIDSWAETPQDAIPGEHFRRALSQLPSLWQLLKELDRKVDNTGRIREDATPRLKSLSQAIRILKVQISERLEQVMKNYSEKGLLQENFTDVHDGRYVIPVKVSQQSHVEGTIYGSSSTRQTVFIEPREVGDLNNQLRKAENDRQDELYQILEELSKLLRPHAIDIENGALTIGYWDQVRAKAKISQVYAGKKLILNNQGRFRIRQAAHPLLWWSMAPESIIKNDLDLEPPHRTLLLTGPNTGGKTVFLKTLGIAGIFARTGFLFPGDEAQTVPFFESLFVDLGDPQSIEEHLSSFSGHIKRFKNILDGTGPASLVLLDELNSATDPSEGAALGRAFLETVMNRGSLVVATTHDPMLKAAALEDKRILNAGMEFNESSRAPTFRLKYGVVGRSRALETAERLGLPAEVLSLARKFLSDEHHRFESVLSRMETESDQTEKLRREASRLRDEAEQMKREWESTQKQNMGEVLAKTRSRLRQILDQAQDEVRAQVRSLNQAKSHKAVDENRSALNDFFRDSLNRIDQTIREEAPNVAELMEPSTEASSVAPTFKTGDLVRVPKWKSMGKILEVKGEQVKIQLGLIQVVLSKHEIDLPSTTEKSAFSEASKAAERAKKKAERILDNSPVVPNQIDLRGKRHDDAMSELESYIDQAFRSGLVEVTIVHGLGSGALREGSRKILKSLPYIKAIVDGGLGAGGAGATRVEFER